MQELGRRDIPARLSSMIVGQPADTVTFATMVDYVDDPRYAARAHLVGGPLTARRSQGWADDITSLWNLLLAFLSTDVLLLHSSWGRNFYPGMLIAILAGFWPRRLRPVLVLMGDMWQPNPGPRHFFERIIVRLADRGIVRYAVLSSDDVELLSNTWDIDPSKIRSCSFFFTITDADLAAAASPDGDHIFAGGNSHRDYETLLAAARQMPDRQFICATSRISSDTFVPPNVRAGYITHAEFMDYLRTAAAVVVPLQRGLRRSVAQQTYLNAMWLGKPIILPDVAGVREFVKHGETGFIVDGSPDSYVKALNWVLDPDNYVEVALVRDAAQRSTRQYFTFEKHVTKLLEIVNEAIIEATR